MTDHRGLIEWLRAQIDEDEMAATQAGGDLYLPPWVVEVDLEDTALADVLDSDPGLKRGHVAGPVVTDAAVHIARHDPARVLREVEAKRRLLDDFGGFFGLDDFSRGLVEHSFKLLALPFSDRPGYREEWKP